MAQVSAPYNFVPLNKKVFFPPWAELVTHDVPFENGLSGEITLKITAESPIFIRKPYEEGDDYYTNNNGERISKEFCYIKDEDGNKQYYIPGSSLRNMLRSMVEIMSFSKLGFFNKPKRFAFRDMANPNLYNLRGNTNELRMGWLINENSNYKILDVGKLIPNKRERYKNFIYRPSNYNQRNKNFFKYLSKNDYNKFINPNTSLSRKYEIYNDPDNGYKESAATLADYNDNEFDDVIVITGNIEKKRNEFVFPKPSESIDTYNIKDYIFDDFIVANTTKDGEKSDNWSFWAPKFNNNEPVPVFFRLNEKYEVIDFGLVVLYKMAYKNALMQIIQQNQPEVFDPRLDMAETLFGSVENYNKLKGRIHVKHAFSENAQPDREYNLILGEPKISFYPTYIKQNVQDNGNLVNVYKTLHNDDAEISGRKRYPIHYHFNPNRIKPRALNDSNDDSNVSTHFIPLRSDTVFNTKINYHNLLPVELGALLSAITFHLTSDTRHNIGFAKPYGFGKIKVEITNMDIEEQKNYIGLFEKVMGENIENWLQSKQLRELVSMAHLFEGQDVRKLKYLDLQDHQNIKKTTINRQPHTPKALPLYSKFMAHSIAISSIPTTLNTKIPDIKNIKVNLSDNYKKIIDEINDKIKNQQS